MPDVAAHRETEHLTVEIDYPGHPERGPASEEFRSAVAYFRSHGLYVCWCCGSTEDVQVHHFGCEWSEWEYCDPIKLKATLELLDFLGLAAGMKDIPITSVDDIRNLMPLCRPCHEEKLTGIHYTLFPFWIMQRVCKSDCDPVPRSEHIPAGH